MSACLLTSALLVTNLAAPSSPAGAAVVHDVSVEHRHGQTFLTWTNLPGTGWRYHVYSLDHAPDGAFSPATALAHGAVGDSSAVNRRLGSVLGTFETFRIDSAAAPLSPDRGLFVITPSAPGTRWYVITADSAGQADSTVVPGENAMAEALVESPDRPRPVWQRAMTAPAGEVYVWWGGDKDAPLAPAFSNAPSRAFHFGLKRGAPGGPLVLSGHGRGGSFANGLYGMGLAGESVICVDDHLDTVDGGTWYFGHHEGYVDTTDANLPPLAGEVMDYTERRVLAIMDWAAAEVGHDVARVYATGASMGGTFAVFMCWHHPDRVAAGYATVPKVSFARQFEELYYTRFSWNRLWGDIDVDLPCANGRDTYAWIDPFRLVNVEPMRRPAPLIAFFGRMDDFTGWAEKVTYLRYADTLGLGGALFWDTRNHVGSATAAWSPMHDPTEVHRFRLDRSYPAFMHASTAQDPGTGVRVEGDSVGTLTAAVDFDTALVDQVEGWSVVLRTRDLHTTSGTWPAPESLTVDVSPRRLQRFRLTPFAGYAWRAVRRSDGEVMQSGWAATDANGFLTVPGVTVRREDTRLEVGHPTETTLGAPGGRAPRLFAPAAPLRAGQPLRVDWSGAGAARADLFDLGGRRVAVLWRGEPRTGSNALPTPSSLAAGVYWVRAEQAGAISTARIVVLR